MTTDWHYANPSAAYLLFLTPVVVLLYWLLLDYRQRMVGFVAANPVVGKVVVPRWRFSYLLGALCVAVSWVAATLALMQPQGNGRYAFVGTGVPTETKLIEEGEAQQAVKKRKAHEVVFLLDASASMEVPDTRSGISRLAFAKEIIDELVSLLNGESVALYAFTSQTTPVVPATLDYLFMRMMTKQVAINEGDIAGTDFAEALELIKNRHLKKDGMLKTIVILSDGGDTHLQTLKGEERAKELNTILSRLADVTPNNARVFTIGLGTAEGADVPGVSFEGKPVRSSLDEELLTRLSEKGRGRYYFANRFSAADIVQDIAIQTRQDDVMEVERSYQQRTGRVERLMDRQREVIYDRYFQYPLAIAALSLLLALLLPEVKRRTSEHLK